MLAEFVITYLFYSTEPAYPRTLGEPFTQLEISLNVENSIGKYGYFKVAPFVTRVHHEARSAGGEAEIGIRLKDVDFGYYHKSIHGLDQDGEFIEADGIRLRWRLK